jgi:ribosome recycling factor
LRRLEDEVQKVTDTFIESIDNELKKKEADLLEI